MRLREIRQRVGMTPRELAEAVGTSRVNISRWENGKHEPSGDATLKRLSVVLGCSVDELLGDVVADPPTPRQRRSRDRGAKAAA